MDEFLEVDEEELLTFESELIKHMKRTDFVSALPLEKRTCRMREKVMQALEEASSTSPSAGLAKVVQLVALRS